MSTQPPLQPTNASSYPLPVSNPFDSPQHGNPNALPVLLPGPNQPLHQLSSDPSSIISPPLGDQAMWVLPFSTLPITDVYLIGPQLGQPGQFGHAALVQHRVTGEKRAVKIISKGKFSRATDRKVHFQELRTEIEIMKSINHINIIKSNCDQSSCSDTPKSRYQFDDSVKLAENEIK